MRLTITRLAHATDLPLPAYATAGSAGMDLRAAINEHTRITSPDPRGAWSPGPPTSFTLYPHARVSIPTGLVLAILPGFEGQVRPRSGRALAEGLTVLNAPGTIDSDFRGEVVVLLVNLGSEPVTIRRGDRIAQLVVAPVARAVIVEGEAVADTGRGVGGLGSTGVA